MKLFQKKTKEPIRYLCKYCGNGYDNRQEAINCHPNITEVDPVVETFLDQLAASFDNATWELIHIDSRELSFKFKFLLNENVSEYRINLDSILYHNTIKFYYKNNEEVDLLKAYHNMMLMSAIEVLLANDMPEYIPVLKGV